VDGRLLPRPPLEDLPAGVPLLTGTNLDEARLFFVPSGTLDTIDGPALETRAARHGLSAEGLAVYGARRPAGDTFADIYTDWRYRMPAIELAEASRRVWMYRLDGVPLAADGGLGSCHTEWR
jgi:para-nitrobenzyl esterase